MFYEAMANMPFAEKQGEKASLAIYGGFSNLEFQDPR
jgi:hypothetical protein